MIGATHCGGSVMNASMLESPDRVAGNPPVVMFTVPILLPLSTRQLTSARNCVSSLIPRSSGGTDGSFANTRPWTFTSRWPFALSDPFALVSVHGSSSPSTPRMDELLMNGPSTPYIVPNPRISFPDAADVIVAGTSARIITANSGISFFIRFSFGRCVLQLICRRRHCNRLSEIQSQNFQRGVLLSYSIEAAGATSESSLR